MAGREAEFSEGREWLGLRRDEEEQDTLFELIGTTCGKGQSTIDQNEASLHTRIN